MIHINNDIQTKNVNIGSLATIITTTVVFLTTVYLFTI